MAIKPPDLLNRLPSVAELLDNPQVRALADRWNRSVVAGGVRTFLEELRSDFERRAAELPSIRELAERAARYVVSRQHHSLGVAINATGRISGPPWTTTPISETALESMIALGREYGTDCDAAGAKSPAQYQATLCRLTGAQSAVAVHNYSGAVWLALATLATDREVLVARAEVGDVNGADSLPKLVSAAQAILKEVGATNRTTVADYESAASPRATAILKLSNDSYSVVGDTAAAELHELVQLAHNKQLILVDALGAAPLVDPPAGITLNDHSAQASVAAGADLVILRGDTLVGGPTCGILVGREDVIGRIVAHPLFAAWELDPLRAAALTATLAGYDNSSVGIATIPVWQCLTASVDNLRNRAERIAAQLAHASGVASAMAVETRSPIMATGLGDGWPSYGVALKSSDGNVTALDERLRTARVPIFGRIEGDQIVLDLRTIVPRQDKMIVDALLDTPAPAPAS